MRSFVEDYGKTIIVAIVVVGLILVATLFATDGKASTLDIFRHLRGPSYEMITSPSTVKPGEDATFISDAPFDKFNEVCVDGKALDPDNYTASGESTKIMLKGSYTGTLSIGKHTIEVVSNDGFAKAVFNAAPCKIVSWAEGTDAQIAAMVAAADAGKINLADYWSVGDERQVTLSAMDSTGVGESHAEQTVTLVLLNQGGYELTNGKTCNFIVGQKNCLAERGYINSTATNDGSWDGSARKAWCNSTYYNAYPETLKPIFKQFKTITAETYNGTTLKTSNDYFALAAQKEIFGGPAASADSETRFSNLTEFNALTQFEYYKDSANRIKKLGDSGLDVEWWGRSPRCNNSGRFCGVGISGRTAGAARATYRNGLAPFGCI